MGKLRRFLGLFVCFMTLIFASNSFAAGYTCPDLKKYISCNTNKHLTSTEVGNSCVDCPDNSVSDGTTTYCTCNTGYENPDGIEQGQVVNGEKCTIKSAPSTMYYLTLEANGGAIDISGFDNCSATDTGAKCSCTNGVCNLPATSAMTRDGYQALGWAKSSSATSAEYTTEITILADTTLYAVWDGSCEEVAVYYEEGNQGNNPDKLYMKNELTKVTFYSDASCSTQFTKFPSDPTPTGYDFYGFYTASNVLGTKHFDTDLTWVESAGGHAINDSKALYAVFLECKYTVEFNANGGSGTKTSEEWTYGITHDIPENPFTRDGYTFKGWSNEPDGEIYTITIPSLATTCGDTVTLYAIWEENEDDKITITFSCGEGQELQTLPESFKVDFDEEFTIDLDPADYCKRDGYHLQTQEEDNGTYARTWNLTTNTGKSRTLTLSNNSESYNSLSNPGLTSVTVTPYYEPNFIYMKYTVNNKDRLILSHLGEDFELGDVIPSCIYGKTFTFAELSSDAYESYGPWVRNENGKAYQQGQTINCTYEELGVYGGFMSQSFYDGRNSKWIMNDGTLIDSADGNYADRYEATFNATAVPRKFNITYELNGGTNNSENPNTYDVETVVKFKTPTRANSDFVGWYKESTFATDIANTSAVMGDLTLYAKWTCKDGYNANADNTACVSNAVTVKYAVSDTRHWNNWVAPSSPTECPVGGACTIPEPVSETASGYAFKEWRCTLTNGADCGTFRPGDTLTASADWVAASQEITLTAYTRSTTYVVQVYGGAGTYKAFNCTYGVDCNLNSLVSQVGADSSKLIGLVCQNTVNQIPDVCETGMSIPLGTVWNLPHSVKGDDDTIKLNLNVGLVYQCSRGQYLVAPSSTSAMSCAACPKNSYCGGQDGNGTDTEANYQFAYMNSDKYKTSCATATNNVYSYTEGTDSYSVNQCYRNCTSDDVPTGQKLTGGTLFADGSGTCEYECVDGYYCPPDADPVECPEDDKGRSVRSPANATSAADCFVECEDLDGVSADKVIINYENDSYPACEYSGIDCPDGQHLNDAKDGCVANTFTVQFDNGDGATGTMNSVLVTYNDGTVAPKHGFTVPQPAGSQEFVQWSCASKYGSCGTVMPGENISTITDVHDDVITLTAIWEAVTFTITYDKNASDATAGEPATAQVKYGDMFPELDLRPTRAGYSFGGYYPSTSCSNGLPGAYLANGQPNAQFLETKDITLYACWIACAPGSFCGPDTPDEQGCPSDDEGRKVSSPAGATQSSDCFVQCFDGTVDNGSYSPVADEIHYANGKYASCEYNVSCNGGYHANGLACDANVFNVKYSAGSGTGTGPASPLQCTYGQNCPAPSNTYTYPGFVFTNWACTLADGSSCGNVEAGDDISTKTQVENATITLTAQWQAMGDGVCYAGMYFDGSAMVTCPQGSFCDGSGTYPNCHIETCDSGYNTDGTGAKGESSCKKQSVASCVLPASCPDGVAKCEFDTDDTYECTMVQGTAGCTPNAGVDTACPLIVPENPDPTDPEITCSAGYYFDPSDKESPCKKCSELGGGFTLSANGNFAGPGVCYKVCSEDCPECPQNQVCNSGNWGNTLSGKQYYNTTRCVLDNGEQCGNGSGDVACNPGFYPVNGVCVECEEGDYCDGNESEPCPSSHPNSDAQNSDKNMCYADCTTNDVTNSTSVSGIKYYGGDNTCQATMCKAGFYLEKGKCVSCPENEVCDGETRKTCSELTGGEFPLGTANNGDKNKCYRECSTSDLPDADPDAITGNVYADGTKTCSASGCQPGHYPDGNGGCTDCEPGDYCDGNESVSCPSSHPKSDAQNSDKNMCYADCTTTDIANSTSVSGIKYYGGDNTCQATMCKAGFYLEKGKCVSCPENEVCDGETRKTCSELTGGEFPLGTANNGDKNKCYRECSTSDLPDADPDAITGNVYADGTKTCSASGCQPGHYPDGNGGCTDCEPGDYCDGNESVSCPPDYPKSDANAESVNDCYADCTTTDIANSATVSGIKYYNQPKQCKLGRCQSGYKPVNNTCEKCGEGEICDGGEDTTCQPGYYPNGNGGCVECEPGNVCDGKGKTACPSSHPNSAAKNSDKNKCYTNCTSADIPNAGTVSGIKYYDGTNTCSASGCQSGYYPKGGECLPCEPGNVCDGKGKVSCPSSHPSSDAQNSDKNKCYTSCKTSAVANSVTVSGRDYFGIADTCQATKCEAGYYLQDGKCVSCPEGEVCDGKTRKTCSELTNGKYTLSDGMASSADDCYAVCTTSDIAHSSSVSGRKTLKNPNACVLNKCVPGYQKVGNVCEQCSEGNWCPGDETENSCPDSHPLSNAGASAESQCFKECESYMEYGCTAIPKNETEYHPNECSYRYESETGNPSVIKNGKCVETACKPNYEMINGKCQLCNRENALTYLPEGNCRIETCMSGYHPNGERCDSDVAECRAPKATVALQSWDYTLKAYGVCVIYACEDGYHIASNTCVADVQECSVENGVGVKEWNWATGGWGECEATHCNPGFTNDPALTNERTKQCGHCKNKFSVKGEIAVSSYVEECEIASCMYQGEMYNLDNNECHPICDVNGYEDETGYMKWNPSRRKCERTCKEGYSMW